MSGQDQLPRSKRSAERQAVASFLPSEADVHPVFEGRKSRKKRKGFLLEIFIVLVQALVIATAVRTFAFQSFNIPSGSLIPSLLPGDYVFVSKYAYGYSKYSFPIDAIGFSGRIWASEPKRGDIAVFHNDRDGGKDYIKRVIGLPGDRIRIMDAVLFINDKPVKKELIGTYETDKPNRVLRKVPLYRETLPNGVSYKTIEVEEGRAYLSNTSEYIVPAGHYFMMGDNREDSQDSRVPSKVGFVPFENFIGKAELVYFSTELKTDETGRPQTGFGALLSSKVRWKRLLLGVH